MSATYLSVDLDYWGFGRNSRSLCTKFFNKLFSLGVPILVVQAHHHMLDDVNRSRCRRIEHIDYHSDLVDWPNMVKKLQGFGGGDRLRLNCGTWLNYVKWRDKGEIVWRYPSSHCMDGANENRVGWGMCHAVMSPFKHPVSGWANVEHKLGLRGFPWHDVAKVGVAISEEYWHDDGETYESVLPRLLGVSREEGKTWSKMVRKRKFRGMRRRIRP